MPEGPSAVAQHGLTLPLDVWQLVMDALFNDSSPEDHCYRNQRTYHNWSLVCHAWRIHAQSLLFRTVELTSPESLHRFSTLLDFAPHLALYVRSLRVYSRHLFTPHNVLSVLPDEINAKLPNLRALAVTRISNVDSWHPLASQPVSPAELPYVPLSQDFPTRLAPLSHVTTLKLYFVSFPCFCELARIVRAFHNLRVLAIIEVHWRFFDPPPFMLNTATEDERNRFLPKIEDLTLSWLDEHGPEHILAALGPSSTSSLKHLYVDCPPSLRADEQPSQPLDLDLSHCAALHDFWISVPHPLSACPDVADTFASLLASWRPARAERSGWGRGGGTPTLTITPTFESDFSREQFVDILRALGPIAERALLDRENGPEVCICVIDRAEKHNWWAETVARECLPRMYARGRVRASFWKRYWDDCTWSEDRDAGTEPVESPPNADTDTDTDTDADTAVPPAADVLLAAPGLLTANPGTDVAAPAHVDDADAGTPPGQRGGDDSYVAPASTSAFASARTRQGSVPSVSGSAPGARRSLKSLPGLALSKATKFVRALVGRTG